MSNDIQDYTNEYSPYLDNEDLSIVPLEKGDESSKYIMKDNIELKNYNYEV